MTNLNEQISLIKTQLEANIKLEEKKWEFRKKELAYLEAGQHMRALNQLMWQVPSMAVAITGGLWYGAATIQSDAPRAWVLAFVAVINLLTIVTLWRLRAIISEQISAQDSLHSAQRPSSWWPRQTVITCWSIALLTAAAFSIIGALYSGALNPLTQKNQTAKENSPACQNCVVNNLPAGSK